VRTVLARSAPVVVCDGYLKVWRSVSISRASCLVLVKASGTTRCDLVCSLRARGRGGVARVISADLSDGVGVGVTEVLVLKMSAGEASCCSGMVAGMERAGLTGAADGAGTDTGVTVMLGMTAGPSSGRAGRGMLGALPNVPHVFSPVSSEDDRASWLSLDAERVG
jgi:hypothetical protein